MPGLRAACLIEWNRLLGVTTMLAEVRLIIAPKEARLVLKHGDDIVEDELWSFDGKKISRTEARELAGVAFNDAYDLMNAAVHGD